MGPEGEGTFAIVFGPFQLAIVGQYQYAYSRFSHDSEATMSIEEDLSHFEPDRDSTITIGVFDGVHRGHRHLIGRLVQEARSAGTLAGVLTFKNHPITILRPGVEVPFLTDLDERVRLLKELGVDFVVPVGFDRELAGLSSREFLLHLYEKLRMRRLVVGPDFAMGRDRDGTLDTLPAIGESIGFTFEAVDLMTDSVGVVKSTTIRNSIAEGDVSRAARLLGRNFSINGVVGHGEERGRELGFPTANLERRPGIHLPGRRHLRDMGAPRFGFVHGGNEHRHPPYLSTTARTGRLKPTFSISQDTSTTSPSDSNSSGVCVVRRSSTP